MLDRHKFRIMREDAGFTQEQLALKIGVDPHTILRWEKGETARPRRVELEKAAAAIGITAEDLTVPLETDNPLVASGLSLLESELVDGYRNLSVTDKDWILGLAMSLPEAKGDRQRAIDAANVLEVFWRKRRKAEGREE